MIEGHGDDLFRYGDKVKINFSTNIPQDVEHTELMNHLSKAGAIFKNYPEPTPRSVELKLAEMNRICSEKIIVTNGATEAIYLLAQAFNKGDSVIVAPTFREYQDACRVFEHKVRFVSNIAEIGGGEDMAWICNPNNPTGKVFDKVKLLDVIDCHPSIVFVVDQAYSNFSMKEVLSVADIDNRNNVVVLSSLTKQFTIPGLRIGYAIGPEKIIKMLRSIRMPWSVNSIAIAAAHFLLDNTSLYRVDKEALHDEALRLSNKMRKLGIEVIETDCNFILAKLPFSSATILKTWLIENYGILIRDASNFEGLTARHFRVAAQGHDENNLLINALRKWILLFR